MSFESEPRILFEDSHLLILSKPAGLLSQAEITGTPNLVDWLRGHVGRFYVGLIHRLDRNTSGLMVIGKRSKSSARLTAALQEGRIQRAYQAWLVGHLAAEAQWRHWLLKDEERNQVHVVKPGTRGAKEAVLRVRPLAAGMWKNHELTLAELTLETGRSHQIRVQAAREGFPVLGDSKYGTFRAEAWNQDFGRTALHSFRMELPHPMSGEIMRFEDPLPEDMSALCRDAGKTKV